MVAVVVDRHVAHHLAAVTERLADIAHRSAVGELQVGVLQHFVCEVSGADDLLRDALELGTVRDEDLPQRGRGRGKRQIHGYS
ncbi:hypothetical protein D3C72_1387840 [compost metagenome]